MTVALSSLIFWRAFLTGGAAFRDRLAYVRWVRSAGRQKPETDREFADFLGVGEKWLAKWKTSPDAPNGRDEAKAIGLALQPMGITTAWLYDNEGEPPRPELWRIWLSAAGDVSVAPTPTGQAENYSEVQVNPAPKPATGSHGRNT